VTPMRLALFCLLTAAAAAQTALTVDAIPLVSGAILAEGFDQPELDPASGIAPTD
jgi:hypothetical protein